MKCKFPVPIMHFYHLPIIESFGGKIKSNFCNFFPYYDKVFKRIQVRHTDTEKELI